MTSVPEQASKASNLKSVCTIVMTSVGLGILELPASVAKVGSINFAVLMVIIGFASWWGIRLVASCILLEDKAMIDSYPGVGKSAYGNRGHIVVGTCMHVTLVGICACLLVLLGKTMEPLLPLPGDLAPWSRVFWVVVGTAVAQPFVWIKSMNKLGIVSATGVAAVFILAGLIVVGSVREIKNRSERPSMRTAYFGISEVGFAIVMLSFSFGSIPVIPTLLQSMKYPIDIGKVSGVSYVIIGFITGLVAYSGFFAWGDSMTQVDDILDMLAPVIPKSPSSNSSTQERRLDWLGLSCLLVALVVVLTHVVVLIRPVADAAEFAGASLTGSTGARIYRSLPSLLMLLIGSVSVMLLTLVIPPFLYARIITVKQGRVPNSWLFWTATSFLVGLSSFASFVGVRTAVAQLFV